MTLDDIAVDWFTRAGAGDMTAAETAELEAWLDADPVHRAAFDAVGFTWQGIEPLRADPRITAMQRGRPRRRWLPQAIAATLAVAVLGGAGWQFWPSPTLTNQQFRTGVGEKATVTLADGSVVTLSTDTLVRTRKDGEKRLVYLDRGQAYFKVAHDKAHPFEVHAAGRTVTAVGTAFEVRVDHGFKVTLVEGKVRVDAPLAPPKVSTARAVSPIAAPEVQETVMVAGTQLVAAGDTWSVRPADVTRAVAWTRGQLVFVDEPLANVADEMNRYSDRKIYVDATAGQKKISGTFKPGDVATFVSAVRDYGLVNVASASAGEVRLSDATAKKITASAGG